MPSPHETSEVFDREKSPMNEAYVLLEAQTPLELSNLYDEQDQKLMKAGQWDYENLELITNRIKTILESCSVQGLTEEEQSWRQEILWFWYHHAISSAMWTHKDREKAKYFASKALEYQTEDHPNKITRLLYLLANGQVEEAKKFAEEITEEPEKTTATGVINDYQMLGSF